MLFFGCLARFLYVFGQMIEHINQDSAAKNSNSPITLITCEKVLKEKNSEFDGATHFVKSLNVKELPPMVQKFLTFAKTDAEKDILFFSLLTAVGSVLPNVYCVHGRPVSKKYYPNLMCVIESGAATGKGIAKIAIDLVSGINTNEECGFDKEEDEYPSDKQAQQRLLLPANSTYPALVKILQENGGGGLLFTTEIDDINTAWGGSALCDASALFRQNYEHELVLYSRKKCDYTIPCPHFSVLLTGTFSQLRKLINSSENGLLSRFIFVVLRDIPQFDPNVFLPGKLNRSFVSSMSFWKKALREQYLSLSQFSSPIEFCFTKKQAKAIGSYFAHQAEGYKDLGDDFQSIVKRAAVNVKRIAMILSVIRLLNKPLATIKKEKKLYCTEDDFQNSLILSGLIIRHSADFFSQIGDDKSVSVPSSRADLMRKQILALVPGKEFSRREILEIAQEYNFSRTSVGRALDASVSSGEIERFRQGMYRRISV